MNVLAIDATGALANLTSAATAALVAVTVTRAGGACRVPDDSCATASPLLDDSDPPSLPRPPITVSGYSDVASCTGAVQGDVVYCNAPVPTYAASDYAITVCGPLEAGAALSPSPLLADL